MFIRYKPAIFHDMLTLSYPSSYTGFSWSCFFILVGSSRLENFADLCPGYVGSIKETQGTHCLLCCPSGPEVPWLCFSFLRCILVSVLLCPDFLIVKDSSLFYC